MISLINKKNEIIIKNEKKKKHNGCLQSNKNSDNYFNNYGSNLIWLDDS